jgi:hypothetical protein
MRDLLVLDSNIVQIEDVGGLNPLCSTTTPRGTRPNGWRIAGTHPTATRPTTDQPWTSGDCSLRVLRGGSFGDKGIPVRSASL